MPRVSRDNNPDRAERIRQLVAQAPRFSPERVARLARLVQAAHQRDLPAPHADQEVA